MRTLPVLLSVVILAACGAPEADVPEMDQQPAAEEPGMSPTFTLADVAGTWENVATIEGVDEPVPSTLTGSAAGDDWTMSVGDQTGIPMQVSIVGDSLISQSDEYESVLRPGVMVTVRTAAVVRNGVMEGNMLAIYQTPAGEERVNGTIRGTKVQ